MGRKVTALFQTMRPDAILMALALAGGACGLVPVPAYAQSASDPYSDLDALDRQIAVFTGAPIGAVGGALPPLDRRLRLNRCRSVVALSWRNARQDSVLVQCADAGGWRLFVPVRLADPVPSDRAPAAPEAVHRGDAVSIAVRGEGFTVSQPGEALEGGPVGAWIRVRPLAGSTSRSASRARPSEMRARIVRPGLVEVPLR